MSSLHVGYCSHRKELDWKRSLAATSMPSLGDNSLNCIVRICAFFFMGIMLQHNAYFKIYLKSVWVLLLFSLFLVTNHSGYVKTKEQKWQNFLLGNYCVFRKMPNYTFN